MKNLFTSSESLLVTAKYQSKSSKQTVYSANQHIILIINHSSVII